MLKLTTISALFYLASNYHFSLALSCPPNWFDCGNEKCVAPFFVCDGEDDCGNLLDEMNCPVPIKKCHEPEFQCKVSGTCIAGLWKCDGYPDCEDQSDETDCGFSNKCSGYSCNNKQCIPSIWRCDGTQDCSDGSDELSCSGSPCHSQEFTCDDGSCIPLTRVCDGIRDCSRKEDEVYCGRDSLLEDLQPKPQVELPIEKMACRNSSCSQDCNWTTSGSQCVCRSGFKLDSDQRTCIEILDQENNDIAVISDRMERFRESGLQDPKAMVVDPTARNIYMIDEVLKQVIVCQIDSGKCNPIFTGRNPKGLAFDLQNRILYWYDLGDRNQRIYRYQEHNENYVDFVNLSGVNFTKLKIK